MNICKWILIILSFVSCSRSNDSSSEEETLSSAVSALVIKAKRSIGVRYNLIPMGDSCGSRNKIESIGFYFDKVGDFDIEGGSELYVSVMSDLSSLINSDESLKPFLIEYPFPSKNIKLKIFFVDKTRETNYYPKLSIISGVRGNLEYKTILRGRDDSHLIHEETFEEAKAIVSRS